LERKAARFSKPLDFQPKIARSKILIFAVRPEGACHQWRRVPPRELSIALVADERATTALNEKHSFTLHTRPTPIQQRAFELLGINPDRTQ